MEWPDGKDFAFTVFDDPDAQTLEGCRSVYDFLIQSGLRTTIGVWPCAPTRQPNSGGETCGNPEYLRYVQELARYGFEIGYHNTTPHSSIRHEIMGGITAFHDHFGDTPLTMANHYNAEAIYWGSNRLTGLPRAVYQAATQWRDKDRFSGQVLGSPYFWGDLCGEYVRYCRNFVFGEINTLRVCPWMPYHDPEREYVKFWYASAEGANVASFLETISEKNQDRLEAEHGACIMYSHFGHGFVQNGALDLRFRSLLGRLTKKNGWFVPVSTLLDHLQSRQQTSVITPRQRAGLEWRWLSRKLVKGTS